MERRLGSLLLASGIFLSVFWVSEAVPLQYHLNSDGSTEESLAGSLQLPLVFSLMVLLAVVVSLVNCVTCCKEREINFKEFEDHFDDEIDFTPPAEDTPSMQSPAEVYTLAVSPVPLPGPPHLQPLSSITETSSGPQVARHSLSYIQEVGNGWFGQVLLSEMYTDPGGTRVVVKELKANANSKEQNDFLQQGDPYRVLLHPNILQCLGQCVEAIPFLLVFEYCEMGDLRGYLSQQDWMFRNAELLQLQRMACEIAAGVTHLHKHNFLHSDLALRNCYLTADLTVKVGDYGIGPYRYKEDYIITEDDTFAPLRWLAPELVGERHGGVIALEQSKPSNVWALGVTLWELFENATQPYPHLSDREVLNHVIKEQQVKLFKPQLELPYSDRWYEVLQFCWLSPDRRATAEEVHRLLIYLRMQGQKEMEEDFEQRWDALKPNPSVRDTTISHSSFPILEQFADDALRHEIDEVLTVTETSKGLSFEYVWEAAKHDHYDNHHAPTGMDTTLNYHSMFFPVSREDIQAHFPDPLSGTAMGGAVVGVSGSVPVFDAQKSSHGNEYYIQLEDQGESTVEDEGSRGENPGFGSTRQDFVVLQDVRLDESSTDADFFHQSIDSKDSYLPDSHIWSSLENDSPYHSNLFTEDGSKHGDSPSWRSNFMELPERNGNPFLDHSAEEAEVSMSRYGDSFLDDPHHSLVSPESNGTGGDRSVHAEVLAGNFSFLTEQRLMREGSPDFREQQRFLVPGSVHEPEETFKMSSWDDFERLDSLNASTKPVPSSTASGHELLNFKECSLDNELLVPSITVVADDDTCSHLSVVDGTHFEDINLPQPSDSGFSSTSEKAEVAPGNGPTLMFPHSATTDSLCTYANIASLEDELPSPPGTAQLTGNGTPDYVPAHESIAENGLGDDLTSNDPFSELIEDVELEATLFDQEESFVETNGGAPIRSSLLVSGPSLDQISQDSLLEDSASNTAPTMDFSAETPDSLDSLDIHRLAEPGEELHAQEAPQKLHPPYKISDSGYETENLESPEWNSQSNGDEKGGTAEESEELPPSASLVAPKIVISEVGGDLSGLREESSDSGQMDGVGEALASSSYRDSAYFSDNESEPDKKPEDVTTAAGGAADSTWLRNSGGVAMEAFKERDIDTLFSQQDAAAPVPPEEEVSGITDGTSDTFSAELMSSEDPATSSKPELGGHPKLTRTYANDGHKIREPDMEGRYLGRADGPCLGGQEDGMDADEEDENSDDSDDDLRAYRLHSSSEDSDDEAVHPVPIVVSDDTLSKGLKSLLKPTNLNIQAPALPVPGRINAETSRRGVSFFDDVTVYLFDQETPTKELSDHMSGPDGQVSEFNSPVPTASFLNRFGNSESSTDEEGGGFEWDDDFGSPAPAFRPKTSTDPVSKVVSSAAPALGRMTTEPSWSSTSAYSRFSISPASIASFSLTHLTDSDIEQGGSSEDGEKD